LSESTLFLDDQLGLRIVNLALMKGLITPEEWSSALAEQAAESGPGRSPRPLCLILLERGTLTRDQLHRLRVEAESRPTSTRRAAPPQAAPLLEGSPVKFGKYRLYRELGRGGRGTVYEAIDALDGRRVALKLFATRSGPPSEDISADERVFLAEAEAVLRLPPHPGLARVLEAGVAQGRRYLALEIVDGSDLERWLPGHEDLRARVDLLRLAAEAVHHAHEHGVAHLSLKPRDILIDAKGRARVTDFGVARMSGARLGFDRQADVRALGEILREMLPARDADPELRRIASRADRVPTAADFANELLRWIEGSRRRRRPRLAIWTAAAAVAGVLAVLILARGVHRPAPPAAPEAVELLPEPRGARILPDASTPHRAELEGLRVRPDASGACRLAVDLDEGWSAGTELAELTIEYFDGPGGVLSAHYDGMDERLPREGAYTSAGSVSLRGGQRWISWTLRLSAPRFFNRQSAGGDLRLVATGASELRIRRLALRRLALEELPALRPSPADAAGLKPGLRAELFKGMSFADRTVQRLDAGVVFQSETPDPLGARWTGFLRIPARGRYVLELRSDAAANLTLGGAPVSDLAVAELEPGLYPFRLEFLQGAGPAGVRFACLAARGGRRVDVSQGAFHHQP
jgi:hypothetical protein